MSVLDEYVRKIRRKLDEKGVESFISAFELTLDGRLFKPTFYQKEFLETVMGREAKVAVVSSTRAGKSTSTAMVAVLMAALYPNEDVVVIAPTHRQANIIFDKVYAAVHGSRVLRNLAVRLKRDWIEFANGSKIFRLGAANPDTLLGYGASTLIVDEAASIPDEVWRTRILRMIMSPRNKMEPVVILLSTPHVKNWFYDVVHSGEYKVFRWTWRDVVKAGLMLEDEVEHARKMLSDAEFRAWYEAEFVDLGDQLFSFTDIKRVAKGGLVRVIERTPGMRYVGGLDVARMGDDESALVVIEAPDDFNLDKGVLAVKAVYRTRSKRLTDVTKWAARIMRDWGLDLLAVDAIGMGAGVYDSLYEKFGERVIPIEARGKERVQMYLFFRRLVMEERIILPDDPEILMQFDSYYVKYTSAGELRIMKKSGFRDDVADAIIYGSWAALKMPGRLEWSARLADLISEWDRVI